MAGAIATSSVGQFGPTRVTTRPAVAVPLTGTVGARIDGLDLSRPLNEETLAFLRQSLRDYRVLVVPGQEITHDEQIAFGAAWGELLPSHQFIPGLADYPQIQDNDTARNSG
jgi:alpha-ketoglutarate-dependent taurine dioxygenase